MICCNRPAVLLPVVPVYSCYYSSCTTWILLFCGWLSFTYCKPCLYFLYPLPGKNYLMYDMWCSSEVVAFQLFCLCRSRTKVHCFAPYPRKMFGTKMILLYRCVKWRAPHNGQARAIHNRQARGNRKTCVYQAILEFLCHIKRHLSSWDVTSAAISRVTQRSLCPWPCFLPNSTSLSHELCNSILTEGMAVPSASCNLSRVYV